MKIEKILVAVIILFLPVASLIEIGTKFKRLGIDGGTASNNAALFPRLLSILLVGLTAIWLFTEFRTQKGTKSAEETVEEEPSAQPTVVTRQSRLRELGMLLVIIAYIFLVDIVGYYALTPIMLFSLFRILGVRSILIGIGTSLGLTVTIWLLFSKLMNIVLPIGRFGWYF